jgi:hypothetical protein
MIPGCECPQCRRERSGRSRFVVRAFIILLIAAALILAAYWKP